MSSESKKTGKAFVGVSIVIFVSKLLGFARDIVFASIFGTTVLTDAFQVIFSFPSLLFSSVGTALSSVNIPDLTYYINSRTVEERNRYISNLLAQITLGATLLTVVGIIFAPALTRLIAPGLDGEVAHITMILTRIMMPTLLFVSLTYITQGILQVHSHFLLSASISVPFNLLIIFALVFRGEDILLLGYVTTIGWLLQFLIQLPILVKEGYHLFPHIDFTNEHTVNLFKQLVPILMGNSLLQLSLIIDRSFATHLSEGTTSALAFGSNLFVTITSIFIVAMSTVVFPRLSKYSLDRDFAQIQQMLSNIFKIFLFILTPYLLLVVCYHQEIIALVYERGAFTRESTVMTASAFLFYSFAVIGYAGQEIFNRVYYALKKFKIPMTVSIICLALNIILNVCLGETHGIAGISLSTSFALLLYALIMGILVYREIGPFMQKDFFFFALRLCIPLGGMLAIIVLFRQFVSGGLILSFLLPLGLSSLIYLGLSYVGGLNKMLLMKEDSNS
ncbi:MAG: murein biosynthesis integral membrane protein MurJ [Bacillota bacterium]|nr:murein biosynthesis integral membrane protein MurJ [Bacillota bacterium]